MARPKKKTDIYSIRFPTVQGTEEMVLAAKAKAKSLGMRYSDYARQQLTAGLYQMSVNDNQPALFEHALIHRFKTDVGQQLNQMAKAANQIKSLPTNLDKCLMRLEYYFNHILFSVKLIDDYRKDVKDGAKQSAPLFTHSFADQLMKVGTNLLQLVRIAEKNEDARLDDLVRCHKKLTPLLDRIILNIN